MVVTAFGQTTPESGFSAFGQRNLPSLPSYGLHGPGSYHSYGALDNAPVAVLRRNLERERRARKVQEQRMLMLQAHQRRGQRQTQPQGKEKYGRNLKLAPASSMTSPKKARTKGMDESTPFTHWSLPGQKHGHRPIPTAPVGARLDKLRSARGSNMALFERTAVILSSDEAKQALLPPVRIDFAHNERLLQPLPRTVQKYPGSTPYQERLPRVFPKLFEHGNPSNRPSIAMTVPFPGYAKFLRSNICEEREILTARLHPGLQGAQAESQQGVTEPTISVSGTVATQTFEL